MNYLFFTGAPNTGKSQSIYRLAKYLETEGYKFINGGFIEENKKGEFAEDVVGILEKNNRIIIIQSYNDNQKALKELIWRIQEAVKIYKIDIVITANRSISDSIYQPTFDSLIKPKNEFYFEIPLGKVIKGDKRKANINWYLNSINKLAIKIIESPPFSL